MRGPVSTALFVAVAVGLACGCVRRGGGGGGGISSVSTSDAAAALASSPPAPITPPAPSLAGPVAGSPAPTTSPATRPVTTGNAVFDSRRGGGSFPLEASKTPTTVEELRAALEAGYRRRLTPPIGPVGADVTSVLPSAGPLERPGGIAGLAVNVSGWQVKRDYEPTQLGKDVKREAGFEVASLVYSAEPVRVGDAATWLRIEASDATMEVIGDGRQRGLVLAGARRGTLTFDVPMSDMRQVLDVSAKKGAGRGGIAVDKSDIAFSSADPRSLAGVLTIEGKWLLLPLRLRFSGRMTVDEHLQAVFSDVGCVGEGPAGDLLGPLVNRAMAKMNGRRSPLMIFRDGKTHATDFRVSTANDRLTMRVEFGR